MNINLRTRLSIYNLLEIDPPPPHVKISRARAKRQDRCRLFKIKFFIKRVLVTKNFLLAVYHFLLLFLTFFIFQNGKRRALTKSNIRLTINLKIKC